MDLKTVCNIFGKVAHKWFKIGIQLGIPRKTLLGFKKDDDPLSAVVDYWLNGNAGSGGVPVSWKSIKEVLNSEHVDESGSANQVNQEYCQQNETSKVIKGFTYVRI